MTDEESACRLEALVTMDERGQMVLPKDLRERLGIGPGDKARDQTRASAQARSAAWC